MLEGIDARGGDVELVCGLESLLKTCSQSARRISEGSVTKLESCESAQREVF
jgi:hypothetical protein